MHFWSLEKLGHEIIFVHIKVSVLKGFSFREGPNDLQESSVFLFSDTLYTSVRLPFRARDLGLLGLAGAQLF